MRKNSLLKIIHSLLLPSLFIVGCSPIITAKPSVFPLNKGTTWVYSYEAYQPTASDPNQIITATYQLTETVIGTETIFPYFVAYVKREHELVNADVGWTGDLSSQPNEFWYVVKDQQIFESNLPIDMANIKTDNLILAYDFPLSLQKSWCYIRLASKNPNQKEIDNCEWVGKREVTNTSAYQSPAGNFDNCYEIILYSNGGNIIHWFCKGVGIVFMKFDHAGTRFGFEQTLLSYSVGVP